MKRCIISSIFVLLSIGAYAQKLNSTVDVSNDYLSSFGAFSKSDIPMCIPDSLLQFNKDFDYTVFENPFKGSYEFSPYSVQIKPEAGDYGVRRFYMRAGAGWQMYPVLDAFFSPELKNNPSLKLSIYQKGGGFFGKYCNSKGEKLEDNYLNLNERFGSVIHYDTKRLSLSFDAAYDGVYGGVVSDPTLMHGADLSLDLRTLGNRFFAYRLKLDYEFSSVRNVNENYADMLMTLEPKTRKALSFPLDIRAQYTGGKYLASVVPHIRLRYSWVDLTIGAKLTYWNGGEKKFKINPDVHVNFNIKDAATIYLDADGGQKFISKGEVLHYNAQITKIDFTHCDVTARFNAGVRGRIGGSFEYDVNGGFTFYNEAPLDYLIQYPQGSLNVVCLNLVKYNLAYANAVLSYKSERLDIDAGLHYRFTNLTGDFQAFDLPMFSGSLRLTYNWQKRIFVGIGAEGSTERTGAYLEKPTRSYLPWYIDLGASAEYRITREFGIWVRGTNLLNRTIMRRPLYVEKGINVTGGISLNF